MLVGQVLADKYRIDHVLGEGGMGVVVAAHHLVLDEPVAIKFLSASHLSAEAVVRFELEARAAVKIKSEHVVRVMDVGRLESGAPYMVMEYLDGEDLGTRLHRLGPLTLEVAVDFVLQACVAMADAHSAGIVHRDLKPTNLFLVRRSDGRTVVKVLDFGISKHSGSSTSDNSVTRTGAVLGSPSYMSPEQAQSLRSLDARSDIWSLGVVLFELLTGSVPFTGTGFADVAIKIATAPAPDIRGLRPDLPEAIDAVLKKCLEKGRERRFSNVAELAQALLPFAHDAARPLVERVRRIWQAHEGTGDIEFEPEAIASTSLLPHARSTPSPRLTASYAAPGTIATWSETRELLGSRWALGGIVLVGATLAALGLSASRHGSSEPRGDAMASAAARPIQSESKPLVLASAATPDTQASTAASASKPSPIVIEPEPEPEKPPRLARPKARPVAPAPPRATPQASATTKREPAPAAKIGCDPPYTVDDLGRKRFKPECFASSAH